MRNLGNRVTIYFKTEITKSTREKSQMPAKKIAKPKMSQAHKAALASGRVEGRIVREYLEAVEMHRPKRGRKRTPESIKARLNSIKTALNEADAVTKLKLVQERMDLEHELANLNAKRNMNEIEARFVKIAAAYSKRNNITYTAWREIGVDPNVLRKAGINK